MEKYGDFSDFNRRTFIITHFTRKYYTFFQKILPLFLWQLIQKSQLLKNFLQKHLKMARAFVIIEEGVLRRQKCCRTKREMIKSEMV